MSTTVTHHRPNTLRATGCYKVVITVDAAFPANGRLHKDVWHNIGADSPGEAILYVLEQYVHNGLGNTVHKVSAEEVRAVTRLVRV